MGTLFLIIIIVVALILLSKLFPSNSDSKTSDPDIQISYSTSYGAGDSEPLDTGDVIQHENDSWILNPKCSSKVTISGVDKDVAVKIKNILEENSSKGSYEVERALTPLIVRYNPFFKELEDYITKFKPQYLRQIEQLKESSGDWKTASEKDKEDLMIGFRKQAIEALDVRPYGNLETLFEEEPKDATFDDALIEKYGYENLNIFLRNSNKINTVKTVPAEHRDRGIFEKLSEVGLAIRGSDIPNQHILESLTLKNLNQLAENGKMGAFRRKAQAVESLITLPDIKERMGKSIAFRELFQLKPLPVEFSQLDLRQVSSAWRYGREVAFLIAHTYSMASSSLRDADQDGSYVKGWEVLATEDSCPFCLREAKKKYSKKNCPKTPLHIGCRCCVTPKV